MDGFTLLLVVLLPGMALAAFLMYRNGNVAHEQSAIDLEERALPALPANNNLVLKTKILETQVDELEAKLKDADSTRQHLESEGEALRADHQALQTEHKVLHHQLQELHTGQQRLEAERHDLNAENEELRTKQQHLEAERQELSAEIEDFKIESRELQAEIQRLNIACKEALDVQGAPCPSCAAHKLQEVKLRDSLSEVEKSNDDLKDACQELRDANQELNRALNQALNASKEQEARLDGGAQVVAELQKALAVQKETAEAELHRMSTMLNAEVRRNARLQEEFKALQIVIESTKSARGSTPSSVTFTEKRLEAYYHDVLRAKTDFKQARQQLIQVTSFVEKLISLNEAKLHGDETSELLAMAHSSLNTLKQIIARLNTQLEDA